MQSAGYENSKTNEIGKKMIEEIKNTLVILNSFQDLISRHCEDPDLPTGKAGLSGHHPSPVISKRSQPAGWRSGDPDLSGQVAAKNLNI